MKFQTSRFGEIEVEEESIIELSGGLIGFPDEERYVLIRHNPGSPFFWLQALDRPDLAFVIVDPLVFKPDFQVELPRRLLESLGASSRQDVGIYVIVTIPKGNPSGMTANLLGPVVVNAGARLARQIVLDDAVYSHRHPINPPGREE